MESLMSHEASVQPSVRTSRQLQVHAYTRAGRLDRVEVRNPAADDRSQFPRDIAQRRHQSSLSCLLFRPTGFEEFEELLIQVSWSMLHKPQRIWTATSTCLLELATGAAPDQLHSELTATYGRFGLMNRTWHDLDVDRYYMVAWTI